MSKSDMLKLLLNESIKIVKIISIDYKNELDKWDENMLLSYSSEYLRDKIK